MFALLGTTMPLSMSRALEQVALEAQRRRTVIEFAMRVRYGPNVSVGADMEL